MLSYFSCQNFRSINEKIELNLCAAPRLRRHNSHVRMPLGKANRRPEKLKVLKSAVLYGANASGKSNILKAIYFARQLIIGDTKTNAAIKIEPFKITSDLQRDSSFYFEFVIHGAHFCFGFKVNSDRVLEESLSMVFDRDEINVYHREWNGEKYENYIGGAIVLENVENHRKLKFSIDFTQKNNERDAKVLFEGENFYASIQSAYQFFKYCLIVIFPNTKYAGLLNDINSDLHGEYLSLLKQFDTGIVDVRAVAVDSDSVPGELQEMLDEGDVENIPRTIKIGDKIYFVGLDDDDKINVYELISIHKGIDGDDFEFSFHDESDGSVRLLDLLPTLIQEDNQFFDRTYIIDEFDRSIHPLLARKFIEVFLSKDNNEQLIVSTHQSQLLDNSLLRRDEIWFVQKEWDSSSKLYSLDDYSPRFDKDLQRAYLDGYFGAVPQIIKEFKR